jgi:hypothetical protein
MTPQPFDFSAQTLRWFVFGDIVAESAAERKPLDFP